MIHQVTDRLTATRPETARAQADRLQESAREFEAIFLEKILSQMRSANQALSGRKPDFARSQYESWQDQEVARSISRAGGVGLAEALYRQLQQQAVATEK